MSAIALDDDAAEFAIRALRDLQKADREAGQKAANKSRMKPRFGKTEKDRKAGARQQNETNKAIRRAWEQDRGSNRTALPFPYHTCNGKKNRFFNSKGNARG